MMPTHWYTFHCPEYWTGDKATPEPEMVSCPLCIRKLRAVELPDAPACGGAQVDAQDTERTTEIENGKTA